MEGTPISLRYLLLVLVAVGGSLLASPQSPAAKQPSSSTDLRWMHVTHMRMKEGDNQSWADPDFDDSDWPQIDIRSVERRPGIVWARQNFLVWPEYIEGSTPAALFLEGGASAEVFFNGELIGRNGVPASRPDDEITGNINARLFVPARLFKDGNNVLAIRWSSHMPWSETYTLSFGIDFGPYLDERHRRMEDYLPALLLIGAIGAAGLYFAASYLVARDDRSTLWLSLMLLCVVSQFLAELVRGLYSYPYQWHTLRVSAIALLALGSGVFLNLFIAHLSGHRMKYLVWLLLSLPIVLAIAIWVSGMDTATYAVLLTSFVVAAGQSALAAKRRRPGARLLLVGLLLFGLSFLVPINQFLDGTYYYAMSAFTAALFVWRAMTHEATRRQAAESVMRSNRLKLELLKRQLQPHFIMNTLMALSEWIVEKPATGIKMIQALAAEFRILHAISDKSTIPLAQEIELCEAHMRLMSYRRDQTYELEVRINDPETHIPPAVIHTLLENALTHNRYDSAKVVFEIRQHKSDGAVVFDVCAPLGTPVAQEDCGSDNDRGLGQSYIDARLAHLWGDRVRFESGADSGVWRSRISVLGGAA